jgi:DNA-binding SARP family transcriptional activator
MASLTDRGGGVAPGRAPTLRIHLLGRFEVVRDDAPVPAQAWRRRRPADLLKLVALAPGRTLAREAVVDALWPDKDPASGANNLHRALYDLRQVLGGRWVDIDHGRVRLDPGAWLDVEAFEDALRTGGPEGLATAVALYRGELCPEDRDAPWLAPLRASLRRRFAEAVDPLAAEAAAAGDVARALPLLRRLLEVSPDREDVHAALVRLLGHAGRRAEALRQVDACEAALRAAGRGPPGEELRALRDAIRRGELGPPRPAVPLDAARRAARRLLGTADPAPLRGRGPSLVLLESLLERPAGGLVLLGEPGVGKTRLAVEGARLAQARGATVLCGVASGHGGAAFSLFADLFRAEARAHPGAPDPFQSLRVPGAAGGDESLRARLFDDVRDALATLAQGRPLYLLLDDLHEADESSLNLLHLVLRRAAGLRLVVVATVREDAIHAGTPIHMALAHLDVERLARGVRLPRLGLAATRELVEDVLEAAPPEAVLSRIYRITDGAPLFVEQVARAHREAGELPATPAAAIRARAARLGPRAEAFLAAAAVEGKRFDADAAARVAGLGAADALAALEASLEARLVEEDGAGHRFHHALVREALLETLPPERRAALHAAHADLLEEAAARPGAEPASEAIAAHRLAAGQGGRALRPLLAAGHRAAARGGLREALSFFAAALEQLGAGGAGDGAARLELLDAMGRAQLGLGELAGAARAFLAAAEARDASGAEPSPDARARARRLAAVALAAGGHAAGAEEAITRGLVDAADGLGDEAAALLHLRAQLLFHAARAEEALAAAEACAAAAARAGDADLVRRGRDLAALARGLAGAAPAADPSGALAERGAQETAPEHPVDLHPLLWDLDLLGDLGVDAIGRAASLLEARAAERGAHDVAAAARVAQGTLALAAGRLEAAEAALREGVESHRAAGAALGEALATAALGTALTLRGRFDEAMDLLGEGVVVAERATLRRHALLRLHAAEVRNRLAARSAAHAEEALREASATAARHGPCVACEAVFRPEAVRVALARGRLPEANEEAAALEELARRRGGRVLGALARVARARVLAASGRADEARELLLLSRAAFLAAGHRYEAARCVRLESRLAGPGLFSDPALAALDGLVAIDADA